jgi:hypothetical protein
MHARVGILLWIPFLFGYSASVEIVRGQKTEGSLKLGEGLSLKNISREISPTGQSKLIYGRRMKRD